MAAPKESFSIQADPDMLADMRRIAQSAGRQLQDVVEEALQDFIDKHQADQPRAHVMAHFQASVEKNRELGRLLA